MPEWSGGEDRGAIGWHTKPADQGAERIDVGANMKVDVASEQFLEGVKAFTRGLRSSACPYAAKSDSNSMRQARIDWFAGWYHQKHRMQFKHIWQRWGIEF